MSKTWIIPDIHGYAATLEAMLDQQIKPDKSDLLIFLGDYIDRGPDSKGVLDFIMKLQKSGYNITALKGNHEDSCVKAYEADKNSNAFLGIKTKTQLQKAWEIFGGKQTMENFGTTRASGIPEKYIQWMASLQYFVETEKFIAVHAGLNFDLADPLGDTVSMLWTRDFHVDRQKINQRFVIHGHVPVNLEFIDMAIRNPAPDFIDLDNGIYMNNKPGFGNLVALEANSMEYKVQPVTD